jgi:hypothetical protein
MGMFKKTYIKEELELICPAVANLPNTTPFNVPEGYFEQLTPKILKSVSQKIENQNIESEISPLLQSLRYQNSYQIPEEYFKHFEVTVPVENPKIVAMFTWKRWVGYAAAACFAGWMIGLLFWNDNKNTVQDLALEKVAIENQSLSTETIQTYLHEADQLAYSEMPGSDFTSGSELLVDMTPQIISAMLKEIPENDISSFINQTEGIEMVLLN